MAECQEDQLPQCAVIVHEDNSECENLQQMTCPLCNSLLQLYQINLEEKFLMCGNVDCAYPIGITDYHIYKTDGHGDNLRPPSRNSISISCSSITTGSTISHTDWSELERFQPDRCSITSSPLLIEHPQDQEKVAKFKELVKTEKQIRNNIKKIKELNKQLSHPLDEADSINNEKWLKHIAQMQERSGVQLLKEHELQRVKKTEPVIGSGELKIDIDSSGETISLKIGVLNDT